jgi:hypothetical protein
MFLLGYILAGLSTNPLETAWMVFTLQLTLRFFWWQNIAPILVVVLLFPWLEVHFNVLEANYFHVDLNDLFPSKTGVTTYWIASGGYLAVLVGLRLGLRKSFSALADAMNSVKSSLGNLSQHRILILIAGLHLLQSVATSSLGWASVFRQLVTYISGIRIALMLTLFIHYAFTKKRGWLIWTFLLIELTLSFYSYFGSWKMPAVLFVVGLGATIDRIRTKEIVVFTPIILGILTLTLVWQSVKMDYRMLLSSEQRSQSVQISREAALTSFLELSQEAFQATEQERQTVVSSTFRRIGYLEYYAGAVKNVPQQVDHRRGSLLIENLTFALIPRFLNPKKGIKNDLAKVEEFTDYRFGENPYASFSLGHYCEAYIDWGPWGSIPHLFVFGLVGAALVGLTMKLRPDVHPVLVWSILFVVMTPWGTMQQDAITVFGKVFWNTLCQLVLFKPLYTWVSRFIAPIEP